MAAGTSRTERAGGAGYAYGTATAGRGRAGYAYGAATAGRDGDYVYGTAATKRGATRRREALHPVVQEQRRARSKIRVHFGSVVLVLGGLFLMGHSVVSYVDLQSQVAAKRRELASYVAQYEALDRQNDLYYDRIVSSIDMDEIARIAREELGMSVAREGQVVYYAGQIDDYVKQYADIPLD